MNIRKSFLAVFMALVSLPTSAQIMITPVVESAIDGLTENNIAIVEGRLRNMISANDMASGYGSRFVLACKVAALQREVSGTKIIQKLEVQYAIGDNVANACFGSTSMETVGIGNTEGQAMTSALRNIKTTPLLKAIVRKARQSIINYYDKNGPAIIKKAQGLIAVRNWEDAIYELSAIPEECSCYTKALSMMESVYKSHINHDARQILTEAQAVWSADPNPGYAADEAMSILSEIDPSSDCYPQAKALMQKIENRVKTVTDREYRDAVTIEKKRQEAETALQKARIKAYRDVAVAYAQRKPTTIVYNSYRSWW